MKTTVHASDRARRDNSQSKLQKIARWPLRMARKAVSLLSIHTTSWFIGLTSSWGETNYIKLAQAGMANPYVKRAFDLIKDNWSSVVLQAQTGEGDDLEVVDDHPFMQVLKRPNDETGYQGFVEKIVAHLMFGGELFFYTQDSPLTGERAGVPQPGRRFELIRPDRILEFIYGDQGRSEEVTGYRVAPKTKRGLNKTIPASRIKHVKLYNPYDEERGFPLLLSVWRQVQLMEDTDDWNKSVAEAKGRSPGFFVYKGEGPMDDKQFERTKEQLQESYKKDQKHSRPGLLDGDYGWQQAGVTQKEMDWLQGDMANGRKIAIGLGVDPSLLGDQGSRTLANLNEGLRHLMLLRVLPLLDWLLDEWNHHFMPAFGEARLAALTDQIEALQEDLDRKFSRLGTAIDNGLMTINEARGEANLKKWDQPEGDALWKPVSREMLGAEDLGGGDDLPEEMENLGQMTEAEFKEFTEKKLPAMLEMVLHSSNGKEAA